MDEVERISEESLHQLLKTELEKYLELSSIAPQEWMKSIGISVDKLLQFSNKRKDHFRINLPIVLWTARDPQAEPEGLEFCNCVLNKFDDFLTKHKELNGAKEKILEIFKSDWNVDDSKLMSMLAEVTAVELLHNKCDMTIVGFDTPLWKAKKGINPSNADIKLMWEGKEVFVDVKSPTLTDLNLNSDGFRDKFSEFSKIDFLEKFGKHEKKNVHRVLMYIYKYKEEQEILFTNSADHLKPIRIDHKSGDKGLAQIYWMKLVSFKDGSRGIYLLDTNYTEAQLLSDLSKKN